MNSAQDEVILQELAAGGHTGMTWSHPPAINPLPTKDQSGEWLLVDLYLHEDTLTSHLLWKITIPVIRKIAGSSLFNGLVGVKIRVSTFNPNEPNSCSERVMCVAVPLPLPGSFSFENPSDLLQTKQNSEISCWWYREPKDVLIAEDEP